ncbi:transcription termination/antitermination factor NusG [bacterium]|nr:transcription termination/antitermination factor NusG [bacterium]
MAKEEKQDIIEENTEEKELDLDSTDMDSKEKLKDKGEWYILQCYSSQEYKVKAKLEYLREADNLEDKILEVLIPEEETIEIKNNKRVERVVKKYPGYVFIQADMDDELSYIVRRVTGVAKFVGAKNMPTPVKTEEILKILKSKEVKTKTIEVDFEIGEVLKIVDGPFRGYSGPISEISPDKGKLKSLISIFGRETPVELDFKQVEKIVK